MHTTCQEMSCMPRFTIHRADVKTTRRSHLGPVEALCDNKFCRMRSEKHLKAKCHTQRELSHWKCRVLTLAGKTHTQIIKIQTVSNDIQSNEAFECLSPIKRIFLHMRGADEIPCTQISSACKHALFNLHLN